MQQKQAASQHEAHQHAMLWQKSRAHGCWRLTDSAGDPVHSHYQLRHQEGSFGQGCVCAQDAQAGKRPGKPLSAPFLSAAPLDKAHLFDARFVPFSDVRLKKSSREVYSLDQACAAYLHIMAQARVQLLAVHLGCHAPSALHTGSLPISVVRTLAFLQEHGRCSGLSQQLRSQLAAAAT